LLKIVALAKSQNFFHKNNSCIVVSSLYHKEEVQNLGQLGIAGKSRVHFFYMEWKPSVDSNGNKGEKFHNLTTKQNLYS